MTRELADRIARAADVLRGGGVIAYPTETFYGLGALASRPDALVRLAAAKARSDGKPLPLIAADLAQVRLVASMDDPVPQRLAELFWPGPLTLVLPARQGLDDMITVGRGTVGVRVPGSEVARALARAAGGPIVATSANLSGEPPALDPGGLSPSLRSRLDFVLDGGRAPGGEPSTVVEVIAGAVRQIRAGARPWPEIEAAVREVVRARPCLRHPGD